MVACTKKGCPVNETQPDCVGCDSSAEVNQEIVDFAVSELQGGEEGVCKRKALEVQNFQTQVKIY